MNREQAQETTDQVVEGSCLCGQVRYRLSGYMGIFQYCHCSRCRKVSGSAHSASLFVRPEDFQWLSGETLLSRYELADARHFASVFCSGCGSSMPWRTQSGKAVVVTAGTLDDLPPLLPTQSIYWASRAPWYIEIDRLPRHEQMPLRT
jgi:hypothetical protein